jgi:anti-sigma regulatory factor (Ser/Thr protein kinase)
MPADQQPSSSGRLPFIEEVTARVGEATSSEGTELLEFGLPLDLQAPAAARAIVTTNLRDRVPARVLEHARLLISELVTNSVRHSGATGGDARLVLRVELSPGALRVGVEDPGRGGVIAPRPPDRNGGGGGFGLNLVHTLSERWGVERAVAGGTRVWAQLPLGAMPG